MGLFDSSCALTGLSLSALEVAAVPLRAVADGFVAPGPPEFGRSDRYGGLDGSPRQEVLPRALVAAHVYRALVEQGLDIGSVGRSLGRPLAPNVETGEQHREGEVFRRHAAAVRAAAGLPWLLAALDACAAEAETEAITRLGRDAPARGWLARAGASAYGVVVAEERHAVTTLDDVEMMLQSWGASAFDPETLTALPGPVGVWVVAAGVWTFVDARPLLWVVDADRRAPLSDLAAASELYASCDLDHDPSFRVDEVLMRAALPELHPPLLPRAAPLYFGVVDFDLPPWASAAERHERLLTFANVETSAPAPPPRPAELPLDDETRAAIERALAEGQKAQAVVLHARATRAGIAAANAYVEARLLERRSGGSVGS